MALQRTDTQSTILSTAATHGSVHSPRTDSVHEIINFGPPVISDLEDNEAVRVVSPRISTSLDVAQYYDTVSTAPIPSSSTNRLPTNGLLYSPAQTITTLASVECHPPSPRPASEDESIVPNPNLYAYLTDWRVEYPHLFPSENTPEPGTFTAGPSDVRPYPLYARGEDNEDDAQRPQPKKRRRRGPRLTRVKNERAKRAAAQAKGKAKAALLTPAAMKGPVCLAKRSHEEADGTHDRIAGLLTRAAARRAAERERAEAAQAATKKNKGKGKARDAPTSSSAPRGSKRRHEEDDGSEDTPQQNAEPGPSRPTRRTRRRIAFEEASAPSADSQPLPPQNNEEQETGNASDDGPSPPRGQKRHRSLAPEPSDGLIEAIRKRGRFDSPAPDNEATSSRVTLDHQQPSPLTTSADEEVVESLMELQYPDPESEDSPEPAVIVDTNILEQVLTEPASPASTASSSDAPPFYPIPAPPQPHNIITQPAPPLSLQHLLNPILPQSISVPVGPDNHRLRRHETQLDNFRVYRPENPDYWRRD